MKTRISENQAENKLFFLAFVWTPVRLENIHQVKSPCRTGTGEVHKVSPAMPRHPLGQISHETAIVKERSRQPMQDIPQDFIHP